MNCPDCPQAPLEEKEVAADLNADVCPKCAGVWLGPGELEQIVSVKREVARSLFGAMKSLVPTTLPCPSCSAKLGRIWLQDTNTDFKSCTGCKGHWLANKQLRDIRAHLNPSAFPSRPPLELPPQRGPSLISDFFPSLSSTGAVIAIGGIASYFVFIGILIYAPPHTYRTKPPSNEDAAPAAAPAAAPPAVFAAPEQRGPSEMEVQAMVQAAVKGALTPAPKRQISSAVDDPSYDMPIVESRVALVVGVEDYADMPAAEFSTRDATAVRDHLLALGFPPRNVMLLTGRDATKGKLSAALNSWLPKHVDAESTVFFYYSGHGAPDPASRQAYLVPVDGEADELPDTAIPLKHVYSRLSSLKAKRVIVALDSCFSGLGGRSVLSRGVRPLIPQVDPAAGSASRITVLSASGPDQISGTLADEGHGAFTYYLLEGLNGAAKDPNGAITIDSLYRYLKPRVQDAARLQKRNQTPQMVTGANLDFVLRQ